MGKGLDCFEPGFRRAVENLIRSSGGRVWVESGCRTTEEQADLYERKPDLAAPPGRSNHEKGFAVDLGGDLGWVKQNGPRFGLWQPMDHEPWHWEPVSKAGMDKDAYTAAGPGSVNGASDEQRGSVGYQLAALMELVYRGGDEETDSPLKIDNRVKQGSASPAEAAAESGKDPSQVAATTGRIAAGMGRYSGEQQDIARTIARIGREMGFSDEEIVGAISAGIVESGLRNLNHGDRDSLGVFQQRPSQGWGSREQVTNVEYAARKFFDAFRGSKGSNVAERVANTQRPAKQYRGRYAERMDEAWGIFRGLGV